MPTIRDIVIQGLTELGKKQNLSSLELESFVTNAEIIFMTKAEGYNRVKHRPVERSVVAQKVYETLQSKKNQSLNISLFNPTQVSVLSTISNTHSTSLSDLGSISRKRDVVDARYQFYAIVVLYLNMTISSAGKLFNQDHTTVINALRVHSDLLETNKPYLSKFVNCLERLKLVHEDLFDHIEPTQAIRKYAANSYIEKKKISFENIILSKSEERRKVVRYNPNKDSKNEQAN
jgi:hypothetical protein